MNAFPLRGYRASLLHFREDPAFHNDAVQWFEDGLLLVENGQILAIGDYTQLRTQMQTLLQQEFAEDPPIEDWRGKLIVPGFIDTHTHYPQTDIIASPAKGLLPWLNNYTFPAERRFSHPLHAGEVAAFFIDELLRNGTTTAAVFGTSSPVSVDAFFAESYVRNLRMIAGKCLMDRNCPDFLQDTAEEGIADSEALIKHWHKRGRQGYAITVRFAPTSTPEQLRMAGELAARYPDTWIQTHLAENREEVAWVKKLFPRHRSYLDVYDKAGLMRKRALYAHSIWIDQHDRQRLAATQSAVALCPTSNLFLGSGIFDFARADAAHVPLSLATDVGGGTSFSMLRTMDALYKLARLGGTSMSALRMFYLATLGGAQALQLEGAIGHFAPGCEADFVVLDPLATPLLARRTERAESLEELLFALAILGDDRTVAATYSAGRCVHRRG